MINRNMPLPPIRASVRFAMLLTLAILALTRADAQSMSPNEWQFEATPYLFASSMKGDTQAGPLPRTSIDLSFSDIVDALDFGFMGTFEARKNRWMIFTDAMYMNVSGAASVSGTGPGGAPATVGADARIKQTMAAIAAGYRAIEGMTALDLMIGGRYNKIDASADISGSLFGVGGTVTRGADKSWWDPYLGARIQHKLNDRWTLVGYADIGGFGVGSELTWQVLGGVTYRFSDRIVGKIAYRAIKVDYDKGGFLYDMKNEGLLVGMGIRF